jgi:WXG100 family type VII secretion target
MSEILIHGDDLQQAAGKFISASGSVQATLKELDDTVTALEKKWSGSTQQVFYRKYKDLHQAMEGMSALMKNIALEITAMADRMGEIDDSDDVKG